MTDELQNGSLDSGIDSGVEDLDLEQGAELATDSDAQHEEKAEVAESNTDVNQDAVQAAINKQHAKYREEERKRKEVEQQLEEYRRKENEALAARVSALPEFPDEFDDNYDEKLAEYKKAVHDKAMYDAQQQLQQQQLQQQQQMEQARLSQEFQQKALTYEERAKEFGISEQDVKTIGQTLVSSGLNEQLAVALLDDPEGPLIAKYLSSNIAEIDALQNVNPYLAGAKLVEVKQKAQAFKPKTSSTPEPPTRLEGGAVDPDAGQYKYVKGGSFE